MKNTYGDSTFNVKDTIKKILAYKFIIISIVFFFILVAFLYNQLTSTQHSNEALLLVEKHESNFLNGNEDFMSGFGMFSSQLNIDNEIELIKSYDLVQKTIINLDLTKKYFRYKNNLFTKIFGNDLAASKKELYNDFPVSIIMDASENQSIEIDFKLKLLSENELELEVFGEGVFLYNYIDKERTQIIDELYYKKEFQFGEKIQTKYFSFTIIKNENFNFEENVKHTYGFNFQDTDVLTLKYKNSTNIEPASPTSSILVISCTGSHAKKITDYINSLISYYLDENLEEKNKIALNTIKFIDSQIDEVADSLQYAEANLKQFRSQNQVMDLSYQGQQVFSKINELENEKAMLLVQKKYYNYLLNYFEDNDEVDDLFGPSSMNVVDPILTNLITKLMDLNAERVAMDAGNTNQNLYLKDLDLQIENLKNTIIENVTNSLKTLDISINEIEYRLNKLTSQISQMPKTELQLMGIERKFKLNDAIYTFLLQKRSEAQIARASNLPDYEIAESSKYITSKKVKPKDNLNYLISIFLGLFLPISLILAKDFFNDKIQDSKEIERMTSFPVLGFVYHNSHKSNKVLLTNPQSSVSESFRTVRTNFDFFLKGKTKQVILLTSSFSGEGKTFNAINLATSFALNGYKTVILEFDLRRPKVHQEFGYKNVLGISSFLINNALISDIIKHTSIDNLDLITAGPKPPNPVELIGSTKTQELLELLKEMYDYIIIDSAPVGIVTDTFLLMKHSEVNLFLARQNLTKQEAFANTIKKINTNGIENVAILLNDVDAKKDSAKYGYDVKYYSDKSSSNIFKRILPTRSKRDKVKEYV